jgi:hypothetical protein
VSRAFSACTKSSPSVHLQGYFPFTVATVVNVAPLNDIFKHADMDGIAPWMLVVPLDVAATFDWKLGQGFDGPQCVVNVGSAALVNPYYMRMDTNLSSGPCLVFYYSSGSRKADLGAKKKWKKWQSRWGVKARLLRPVRDDAEEHASGEEAEQNQTSNADEDTSE